MTVSFIKLINVNKSFTVQKAMGHVYQQRKQIQFMKNDDFLKKKKKLLIIFPSDFFYGNRPSNVFSFLMSVPHT